MSLKLISNAFAHKGDIPPLFTHDGQDASPPLQWSEEPSGTKSFALIVDDPDAPDPKAPRRTYVHWVLYNMPASVHSLPEGATAPPGAAEGLNDSGSPGYQGPAPPIGKHRYFF